MFLLTTLLILITAGFANAFFLYLQYLRYQKKGKKVICPIHGRCEKVLGSKFGKTFGIKNEVIGIFYYFFSFITIVAFSIFAPISKMTLFALIIASIATLFSAYLLYVQTFIIRHFCFWCIVASLLNFAIFILEIQYFFF